MKQSLAIERSLMGLVRRAVRLVAALHGHPGYSTLLVRCGLPCLVLLLAPLAAVRAAGSLFEKSNLAAWCIVPFDAAKRGSEERAVMLEQLGLRKFVYDYRKEHIPQWDDELHALKKHHIELMGWWFPGALNDEAKEAKEALELFKRHGVHPQLWISGGGGAIAVKDDADQKARVEKEAGHWALMRGVLILD